jgi:hypothetical protein
VNDWEPAVQLLLDRMSAAGAFSAAALGRRLLAARVVSVGHGSASGTTCSVSLVVDVNHRHAFADIASSHDCTVVSRTFGELLLTDPAAPDARLRLACVAVQAEDLTVVAAEVLTAIARELAATGTPFGDEYMSAEGHTVSGTPMTLSAFVQALGGVPDSCTGQMFPDVIMPSSAVPVATEGFAREVAGLVTARLAEAEFAVLPQATGSTVEVLLHDAISQVGFAVVVPERDGADAVTELMLAVLARAGLVDAGLVLDKASV